MTAKDLVFETIEKLKAEGYKEVKLADLVRFLVANTTVTESAIRQYIRELVYKGKVQIRGKGNRKILLLQWEEEETQ